MKHQLTDSQLRNNQYGHLDGEMRARAKPPDVRQPLTRRPLPVQPAEVEDGWATPPFVLTEKGGKLYGRGSTDDKGPALAWLWAIESHQATITVTAAGAGSHVSWVVDAAPDEMADLMQGVYQSSLEAVKAHVEG